MADKKKLAQTLIYAGAMPFLGAALGSVFMPSALNFDGVILTYGAIIASFIAGIHWGIYLCRDAALNLFVHSNVVALLSWCALLLKMPIVLLGCFAYLLIVDYTLSQNSDIEPWFIRLRRNASVIVCLALIISLLS